MVKNKYGGYANTQPIKGQKLTNVRVLSRYNSTIGFFQEAILILSLTSNDFMTVFKNAENLKYIHKAFEINAVKFYIRAYTS